jgi:hypothetical protein
MRKIYFFCEADKLPESLDITEFDESMFML